MVFFPTPPVSGGVGGTGVDPCDLLLYLNQRACEAKPVTFQFLCEKAPPPPHPVYCCFRLRFWSGFPPCQGGGGVCARSSKVVRVAQASCARVGAQVAWDGTGVQAEPCRVGTVLRYTLRQVYVLPSA